MTGSAEFGTTIILPVFMKDTGFANVELLRRSIDSVRDQKFPGPYELLIVDDGSATPIQNLMPNLGASDANLPVRVIRCARNGGLVHALNRGLAESRYPVIARLDADDRWLPSKIEKQFSLFAQDPDLTITATGMTLVKPSGEAIETHIRPGDWDGILRFFIEVGCPFPHGSVIARRDIFELVGGYPHDPRLSHCEDYALWGIWLRFFKPSMVEEALYDYTVSPNSISAQHAEQQRCASRKVNFDFSMATPVGRVPQALQALAIALGVSLTEAGVVAYRTWRHRLELLLPQSAIEPLRVLLPDRIVKAHAPMRQPQTSLPKLLQRAIELPSGSVLASVR
jgi:glycosyltransferase involved in cell wall biosynthesis